MKSYKMLKTDLLFASLEATSLHYYFN